jgi:predicted DNA-binding protein (UPF0278 family)
MRMMKKMKGYKKSQKILDTITSIIKNKDPKTWEWWSLNHSVTSTMLRKIYQTVNVKINKGKPKKKCQK